MCKAAQRGKASQREYLARLSHKDLKRFEAEWEKRLASWLSEIRATARNWAAGVEKEKRIFQILDEAMGILGCCEKSICERLLPETYSVICHECCDKVSHVIDRRLYRLSNMQEFVYRASRSSMPR